MRALLLAIAVVLAGCASAQPKQDTTVEAPTQKKKKKKKARAETKVVEVGAVIVGRAVWYGGKHHGGKTASGERFSKHKMTAAHRSLPFGARVRVTNQRNGKSVVVRINDRGPFGKDRRRIIDLSEAAARKLDYLGAGWTDVEIEILELPPPKEKKKKRR